MKIRIPPRTFNVSVLLLLTGCAEFEVPKLRWQPPTQGVVGDSRTAISIARAVWASTHPDSAVGSDDIWQASSSATLKDGVWTVADKLDGRIGGGSVVMIARRDGHVVGMYLTQ